MKKNKIFSKELAVGFVGIVALLLIYFLINFFKGIDLFKQGERYYVRFNEIGELVNSSPVYLNGFKAGNVQNIEYDFTTMNDIIVEIDVDKRLRIPVGSMAKITSHMLGGADISIALSKSDKYYTAGDTLVGILDKGIAGEAGDKILPGINSMMPKLDSILTATNHLLQNPALNASIENMGILTGELNKTTALLNTLLANDVPQITGRMVELEDNLLTVSSQLSEVDYTKLFVTIDSTLTNIKQITTALTEGQGTAGLLLKDSTLYNNLNRTCEEATMLLENLRENPKRYVHFSVFGNKEK